MFYISNPSLNRVFLLGLLFFYQPYVMGGLKGSLFLKESCVHQPIRELTLISSNQYVFYINYSVKVILLQNYFRELYICYLYTKKSPSPNWRRAILIDLDYSSNYLMAPASIHIIKNKILMKTSI